MSNDPELLRIRSRYREELKRVAIELLGIIVGLTLGSLIILAAAGVIP